MEKCAACGKEAKEIMRDESVRHEFRKLRQVMTWYDIQAELQAIIDYLESINK